MKPDDSLMAYYRSRAWMADVEPYRSVGDVLLAGARAYGHVHGSVAATLMAEIGIATGAPHGTSDAADLLATMVARGEIKRARFSPNLANVSLRAWHGCGAPIASEWNIDSAVFWSYALPGGESELAPPNPPSKDVGHMFGEQLTQAFVELVRGTEVPTSADTRKICDALVAVMVRLLTFLTWEDREVLPSDWVDGTSITLLFDRLAAARGPEQATSFDAWATMMEASRIAFDGVRDDKRVIVPAHRIDVFGPSHHHILPQVRVHDAAMLHVLSNLLTLGDERLLYRALDPEHLGYAYAEMMGFEVGRAVGPCLCLRPSHFVIEVDDVLRCKPAARCEWLASAKCKVLKASKRSLVEARTRDDVVEALRPSLSARQSTVIEPGALYLRPGEERRRTGSHYTPRSLTQPIVHTTLRPILEDLGPEPTEAQILALKVCDPAMGGGAFLIEGCRQLSERVLMARLRARHQ